MTSAPNPPVGAVLVAQTACPAGKVLLSGSAQVLAPGLADRNVVLRASFPLNGNSWQTVAMVTDRSRAPLAPEPRGGRVRHGPSGPAQLATPMEYPGWSHPA